MVLFSVIIATLSFGQHLADEGHSIEEMEIKFSVS